MARVVYDGHIDGDFEGFDDEVLFKMGNGSHWLQAQFMYWYFYAYSPAATVLEENGRCILKVAGNSVPVARVTDVIESRIVGEFRGWEGETEYALQNGQVWRQSRYQYKYKYAYMPPATVYACSGGHKMKVAGTIARVRRVR